MPKNGKSFLAELGIPKPLVNDEIEKVCYFPKLIIL